MEKDSQFMQIKINNMGKYLKFLLYVTVAAAFLAVSSCATIFNGVKAKVWLTNDNVHEPVNIVADNKSYSNVMLPYRVKVKRGYKDSHITITSNNYEPYTMDIEKVFNASYIANILCPIGFVIDAATGAMMKPEQKSYYVNLVRRNRNMSTGPVIVNNYIQQEKEESGTGDSSGIRVEDIIIRWMLDSDPRGARVFWRVVSSVPQEVKNTNELYLGTTPYEETRSFNILGLTYDNAHNVQIEIRMSRDGYLDQVKRFNVRQALDQQEISTFYDLVPNE